MYETGRNLVLMLYNGVYIFGAHPILPNLYHIERVIVNHIKTNTSNKMNMKLTNVMAVAISALSLMACNSNSPHTEEKAEPVVPKIKAEEVSYKADSVTSKSYYAYDENIQGKRPAILVVPEWWGLGDYVKNRVKQLAELGYVAMAVDMYGDGKTGEDPTSAGALAMPFYKDSALLKSRMDAAIAQLQSMPLVDTSKIAAIGYCFGGYVALNEAKLGAPLKGVVSFHGGLGGVQPNKSLLKAEILICHGAIDNFVPEAEVAAFKKEMDSIGAKYTFKVYDSATHAFTNPGATEKGIKYSMPIKYNAAADTASWNDMKTFFAGLFGEKK